VGHWATNCAKKQQLLKELSKLYTKLHVTILNLKMGNHLNQHTFAVDYPAVQYFNEFFIKFYSCVEG
jgi:hypothetical protein